MDVVAQSLRNLQRIGFEKEQIIDFLSKVYSVKDLQELSCSLGEISKKKLAVEKFEKIFSDVDIVFSAKKEVLKRLNTSLSKNEPIFKSHQIGTLLGEGVEDLNFITDLENRIDQRIKNRYHSFVVEEHEECFSLYAVRNHYLYGIRKETEKEFQYRSSRKKKKEEKDKQKYEDLKKKLEVMGEKLGIDEE